MTNFKCILQNDETDCGPACLAAIFRKYGLKVTIAKIRDIAGTDRQGTNAHGLVKVIEHFGFQQKVVEADKNDYISKFSNISQVSDVSETTINGSTAYTYNFHYKDYQPFQPCPVAKVQSKHYQHQQPYLLYQQ